ncbi:MAG TPA: cytochrome ubiquinol oxidase subunit I [Myxococcota bacterium]|nr:cytochrome ubiquinol oxidase subunit I [Myxococcota bacterium]
MDAVLLARIQFALTIGFHFIFPPLTIGLAWLIFWFMNRYKRTGDEVYAVGARFWTRLFALTFGVGVATGITMEFQFGTNWADYSRFVGDIFGAPLAAEGIFAFFLESTFMGVLLFGWNRFSKKTLWLSSLLVAVGSTLSAFWIIVANSWMQTPAGFEVVAGRAVLTDFWAAVFNPSTIPRYLHTIDACLITGAFFMLGISAWYLLKGRHVEFAKKSLRLSLIIGFAAALMQIFLGHYHAVQVTRTQPEKLAAFEGLFETQKEAPLLIFGIPDAESRQVHAAIRIPGMLSLLTSGTTDAEVRGLNDVPENEWPPLGLTFFSFHLMFLLGLYFVGLTALGMFLLWRKKLFDSKLFMMLAMFSLPLPIVANELGWIAAEVGRQPWIVYRLFKTSNAISRSVPAWQVLASIIMFTVIYSLLFALWIFLLRREIAKGPREVAKAEGAS